MIETDKPKDKNWHSIIGAIGGQARRLTKGFGSNPERARLAGKLGGALSRTNRKLTKKERAEVKKSLDEIVQSLNKPTV